MSTWDNFLASNDTGGWAGVGAPSGAPTGNVVGLSGERTDYRGTGQMSLEQLEAQDAERARNVAAMRANAPAGVGVVGINNNAFYGSAPTTPQTGGPDPYVHLRAPSAVSTEYDSSPLLPQTGGPDPFAGVQTPRTGGPDPYTANFTHGGVPMRIPNETVGTGGPDPLVGGVGSGMSNKQALMQRDWNDAFNSFAPGTTVPFGDGSITFAQGGNAVYTGKDGKAYHFNRNMSLQEVASASPGIAAVWKQQYGFNPTGELQQSGNGYLMDEWYNHQYPFLRDNLNLATSGAVQAGNTMLGNSQGMYDDYEKTFRPTYGKLADFVNQMGDEGYRSTMRGQAMEGVQSQFDLQDAALRRKFQGMGAGSGAMADAMAGQSAGRALAKVKAATDSDNNLRSMYGNGLSGMASLGLNVNQAAGTNANNALGAFGKPLTWGTDLAKTGAGLQSVDTTSKLGLGDLAIKDYTARQNSGVNWFNAESNRIQANNGTTNANTAAQAQSEASNPTNTILGGLAAGGLKWALS